MGAIIEVHQPPATQMERLPLRSGLTRGMPNCEDEMLPGGVAKHLNLLGSRLSVRKLRLFCCALYREEAERHGRFAEAVALAERFADGKGTTLQLSSARFTHRNLPGVPAWAVCWPPGADALRMALQAVAWLEGFKQREVGLQQAWSDVLEDIAGHLLATPPCIDPMWLVWQDGTVANLARMIYDDKDFAQMPILADALEDAGCSDTTLLSHLREGAVHVRGCWALDLILGLE